MREPVGQERLRRLEVLGSAMADRPVSLVATAPAEPPWTDGGAVYLDLSGERLEQVRALAVQASLLSQGSLEEEILRRLRRRRGPARRYLAVEGHRALLANEAFLPPSVGALIDRATARSVGDPEESLAVALGRTPVGEPPACFGEIRVGPILDALERAAASGGPGATPGPSTDPPADVADDADDPSYLGQSVASPVGGGGPIGRLLRRLLGSTRQRGDGGPPGADAATHVGRARSGTGHHQVVSTDLSASSPEDRRAVAGTGRSHPEWDVHRRRYREEWCTVVESVPSQESAGPVPKLDGSAFRRPLARLGAGLVPCRRQPQGDEIDIDAAVEARVDVLAGAAVDETAYIDNLRRRRDLSVLVLLDVSGSANEPGSSGRSVHEHQRVVAATLTAALAELGDRVALYAFNSQGRASVRMMRVKGFDEPLDGRTAGRLGGVVPGAYTRMGAAIRDGAALVEAHGGTSQRLLVVLSDGFAYDHGYEGRYGEADARRALGEARRRGIGCLCLSVGAGVEAAALRRVFGTAAHASVAGPDRLGPLIGPLFLAALRSAESRRRVFQRRARTRERLAVEGRGT